MKRLLIIAAILLILTSLVFAKLSDETLEIVDDLKIKHMYHISCLSSGLVSSSSDWDFVYDYTYVYFEDGTLYVETQDGKWFMKMEKIEG